MTNQIKSLKEILKGIEPTDGVLILVVKEGDEGKIGPAEIYIPQFGRLTEARLEQQMPIIYREIMVRRGQEARKQENERNNETRTITADSDKTSDD